LSTRFVLAALALTTLACETTRPETKGDGSAAHCCRGPVMYPPYKGPLPDPLPPGAVLPPDPGPGLLYTRIVYSTQADRAFAYVVHTSDAGTRLLAIVGPLHHEKDRSDYAGLYEAIYKTYCSHGPGPGRCGCPSATTRPSEGGAAVPKGGKALAPIPPPIPPPPSLAIAVVFTTQDAAVDPKDPQTAGNATGASGAAFPVLNGF